MLTSSSSKAYMIINLVKISCDLGESFIDTALYIKAGDGFFLELLLSLEADFLADKASAISNELDFLESAVTSAAAAMTAGVASTCSSGT